MIPFLITSYIGGDLASQKEIQLKQLLNSIRKYYDDSFILVCDHAPLPIDIQRLTNLSFYDSNNFNSPHGEGEKSSILSGLRILKSYGFNYCYKFNYDYLVTDTSFPEIEKWRTLGKDLVGSEWRNNKNDEGMPNSFSCALGYWNIDLALSLFDYVGVSYPIEYQLRHRINFLGLQDKCFIYHNISDMLGGCINFDFFGNAGLTTWRKYD